RWRDRARTSARMHGRQAHDDAAVRDAAAKRPVWTRDDVCWRRHGSRGSIREAMTTTDVGTASRRPVEVRGGAWLLEDAADDVFTPEQLSDEHRLMAQTTDEFVDAEVLPNLERLENKDWQVS